MSETPVNKNNFGSVKLAQYSTTSAAETEDRKGWVKYGPDNLYPKYLGDLAENAPIHGALCVRIGKRIGGKGITGTLPTDQKQADLDVQVQLAASDLKIFGGYYFDVIYSADGTQIAKIKHIPFEKCRLGIPDDFERILSVWYSENWAEPTKQKNKPIRLNAFSPALKGKDGNERQVYFRFISVRGCEVYGKPDYYPSRNYAEEERQISMFDVNEIMNGFFPSVIIDLFNGQLDDIQRDKLVSYMESKLTGATNASKILFNFNEAETQKPQITPFNPSDMHLRYDSKIKTCREILFAAHGVTSPLLFGIRDGGGLGSNKDELTEADKHFTFNTIEPMQAILCEGLEEIMQVNSVTDKYTIIPNTPIQGNEVEGGEDVASQALNGAQIASLIEIIINVASGIVPVESGKAIVQASFPTLTSDQIESIFTGVVPGSVDPTQVAFKKKVDVDLIVDDLIALGHDVDPDWILIDGIEENDEVHFGVSTGTARPNAKSGKDETVKDVLFFPRFVYSGEVTDHTRPFCRKMIASKKVYRHEDILNMDGQSVNPGFGPNGSNNYPVWKFKGGARCKHVWKMQIYASAKGLGIDVNNPKAKTIAESKAKEMGFRVKNPAYISVKPDDMPHHAFLPK